MVNGTSSANGTSLGFDICMNAYSIDDLLQLLDLGSNPSQAEIVNKIYILNNMFTAASDEIGEDNDKSVEEIQDFFNSIRDKLLDNFKNNTSSNAESANYFDYNIENPLMSQLPLAAPNFEDDTDLNPEELIQCYDITQQEIDMMNRENQEDRDTITIQERERGTPTQPQPISFNDENIAFINNNRTLFKYTFDHGYTNVTRLQLSQITFPAPYTISEYKNNNKFYIIDTSNSIPYLIDLINIMQIPQQNGLYLYNNSDIENIQNHLNDYFRDQTNFLQYITVYLNKISTKCYIRFDLSLNSISNTFSLNFDVSENICGLNYNLAEQLGFNSNINQGQVNRPIISNNFVKYDTNTKLYFSLNDYTFNFSETIRIMSSASFDSNNKNILAVFNITEPIFYKEYTTSTTIQPTRNYNGPINLLNFEIKIIDSKGNTQQIPNYSDITFVLNIVQEI